MVKDLFYRINLRFKHAGFEGIYRRLILYIAKIFIMIPFLQRNHAQDKFLSLFLRHPIQGPKKYIPELKKVLPIFSTINELLESNLDSSLQTHASELTVFKPARSLANWPVVLPTKTIRYTHPPHHLFCLHQASIIGEEGIILTKQQEIFGEGYPWSLKEQMERSISGLLLSNPRIVLPGTYIHGITRSYRNYFHWMFDLVARLAILFEYPLLRDFPLIISEELDKDRQETIRQLGFQGEFIVNPGNYILVEKLLFSSFVQFTDLHIMSYTPPVWVINKLRDIFITDQIKSHSSKIECPRIFISRNDALSRRIINEDDILQKLKDYGFTKIIPGNYSFEDQIKLFTNAEIIIGPHGAGFINILFCNPDVKIIELFSPKFIHRAYFGLTNSMNLEYRYLVGQNRGYQDLFLQPEGIIEILRNWKIK